MLTSTRGSWDICCKKRLWAFSIRYPFSFCLPLPASGGTLSDSQLHDKGPGLDNSKEGVSHTPPPLPSLSFGWLMPCYIHFAFSAFLGLEFVLPRHQTTRVASEWFLYGHSPGKGMSASLMYPLTMIYSINGRPLLCPGHRHCC